MEALVLAVVFVRQIPDIGGDGQSIYRLDALIGEELDQVIDSHSVHLCGADDRADAVFLFSPATEERTPGSGLVASGRSAICRV